MFYIWLKLENVPQNFSGLIGLSETRIMQFCSCMNLIPKYVFPLLFNFLHRVEAIRGIL